LITLVNYGLGNIQAFANIYRRLNVPTKIAVSAEDLAGAEKIILPGVGAFDWAMTRLYESGMRDRLEDLVVGKACPVLGVCVGMQMMAKHSDEEDMDGLGWIDAEVKRFDVASFSQQTHLPHMGWNDVSAVQDDCLFREIGNDARFYFLHSFYFVPHHEKDVLAITDYHGNFTSCVRTDNVFGVQFHPEKSHHWGIQLLKNFAEF